MQPAVRVFHTDTQIQMKILKITTSVFCILYINITLFLCTNASVQTYVLLYSFLYVQLYNILQCTYSFLYSCLFVQMQSTAYAVCIKWFTMTPKFYLFCTALLCITIFYLVYTLKKSYRTCIQMDGRTKWFVDVTLLIKSRTDTCTPDCCALMKGVQYIFLLCRGTP